MNWIHLYRRIFIRSSKTIRCGKKYNADISVFNGVFLYLKTADVYIIDNSVFDKDLDMISLLPEGRITAIGKDVRV